jgi:hypothetical protein
MAASNATMTLLGKSGRTYTVDCYVPDAVATQITFNPTGLAASTSPSNIRIPEDCILYDWSAVAAPTAVGFTISVNSGVINGGTLRHANQLCSLPNRQKLKIPLAKGDIMTALQF